MFQPSLAAGDFSQQGQYPVSYGVSADRGVTVGGIFAPIGYRVFPEKLDEGAFRQIKQRTDKAYPGERPVRAKTDQRRGIAAAKQAQKKGFEGIVAMMGQGDDIGFRATLLPGFQATSAGGGFEPLAADTARGDSERNGLKRNAAGGTERFAPGTVSVRGTGAKPMVEVDRGAGLAQLVQGEQERGAVGTAAEPDKECPAMVLPRKTAVAQEGGDAFCNVG